ncbi:MAG: hypothetical protein NT070_07390 [Cyanobacteria bacterium]|nr:hypothetical protein [Cyanobacteriota bacterium]
MQTSIPYSELLLQIRPGDIIVFSGQDFSSHIVKIATKSDYVHVAIVLSVEDNRDDGNCILLAESHIDTSLASIGTRECRKGAQIQWLEQRLQTCKGPVRWSKLNPELNSAETVKLQGWLWEIEQSQVGYDYLQAIGSGIGFFNAADFSALFCSELVTLALQIVGRVFPHINASATTPAQVMALPCLSAPMEIQHQLADRELSDRRK